MTTPSPQEQPAEPLPQQRKVIQVPVSLRGGQNLTPEQEAEATQRVSADLSRVQAEEGVPKHELGAIAPDQPDDPGRMEKIRPMAEKLMTPRRQPRSDSIRGGISRSTRTETEETTRTLPDGSTETTKRTFNDADTDVNFELQNISKVLQELLTVGWVSIASKVCGIAAKFFVRGQWRRRSKQRPGDK